MAASAAWPFLFCTLEGGLNDRSITSLSNPTVKAARALHLRKEREETGLFLAEGLKIVTEAVELGHAPRILLHSADAAGHPLVRQAAEAARRAGGEVIEVSRDILAKISKRDNPQTVLAVFSQAFAPLESLDPKAARCWVALQAVRDPGNLGTIIRTADAAGCGGVILVGDCCDPYSVEAVRATMGSVFAVPIVKAEVAEFIAWRQGWPGVGGRHPADRNHGLPSRRLPRPDPDPDGQRAGPACRRSWPPSATSTSRSPCAAGPTA